MVVGGGGGEWSFYACGQHMKKCFSNYFKPIGDTQGVVCKEILKLIPFYTFIAKFFGYKFRVKTGEIVNVLYSLELVRNSSG